MMNAGRSNFAPWSIVIVVSILLSLSGGTTWAAENGRASAAAERSVEAAPGLAALPTSPAPVRVAIFAGDGSSRRGIRNVERAVQLLPNAVSTRVGADEIRAGKLSDFDAVVFSGGSASAQAKSLEDAGREQVQQFVRDGGGYVGVCAGAYLACAGFDWGLRLVNARTLSNRWERGEADVHMQFTPMGGEVFGRCEQPLAVHYENGPVFGPLGWTDLPAFQTLARFTSEIAENGTPAGIMAGSPAIAESTYGEGRVIILSPHPEATAGLETMIPLALLRVTSAGDGANREEDGAAKASQ